MYCRVYNSFITGLCYKNMNNLSVFLFNAQTSKILKRSITEGGMRY